MVLLTWGSYNYGFTHLRPLQIWFWSLVACWCPRWRVEFVDSPFHNWTSPVAASSSCRTQLKHRHVSICNRFVSYLYGHTSIWYIFVSYHRLKQKYLVQSHVVPTETEVSVCVVPDWNRRICLCCTWLKHKYLFMLYLTETEESVCAVPDWNISICLCCT